MMRIIVTIVAFFFCVLTLWAQKVEVGTRIVNCSDLPTGSYTNLKRRCPVPSHGVLDRLNQSVYQRFEVAENNYQNVSLGTSREEAIRLCAAYTESKMDVGKWRLPTQRELVLIWILEPVLIKESEQSGFRPLGVSREDYYWSATDGGGIGFQVDAVGPLYGSSGLAHLSDWGAQVRCVRDLDIR